MRKHFKLPTGIPRLLLAAALVSLTALPAFAVVITEVHYHPSGTEDEQRRGELIELFNEDPDPVDLTGCYFSEGIDFRFEERTILKGFSYLVVGADAAYLKARHGIANVVGDWDSSTALSNGGEDIVLASPGGAALASLDYNDRGEWPAAADGTGHTLSIRHPYLDPARAASWTASAELGGTPGAPNFPQAPPAASLTINEGLLRTAGARWVEVYNAAGAAVDLAGYFLTDDPSVLAKARLPQGSIAPGRGWLVLEDAPLGLNFSLVSPVSREEVFVALVDPGGTRVVTAFTFKPAMDELSEARLPDGAAGMVPAADPTPGAANTVSVPRDVVLNEINYHAPDEDSGREFIELFNRGDAEADLSGWRLSEGVRFTFPPGTRLAGQGFLVVARDPARIRALHGLPASTVIGPEDDEARAAFGVLSDGGERITLSDTRGNPADTVSYGDGGEWPSWPDGGGSTLELIDPRQDNDSPQAWDASDDSAKAPVTSLEYTSRVLAGQTGESEIHVMLLSSGITLVDDLHIPGEMTTEVVEDSVLAEAGSVWRWIKGTEPPSSPIEAWRDAGFDDSAWSEGALPVGYGESGLATEVPDMRFSAFSLFLRKALDVPDANAVERLYLEVDYDDGFIAYLNGTEIARRDLEGDPPAHDAPASTSRESGTPVIIDITSRKSSLRTGPNVLAVQVHNNIINSPDCYLDVRLYSGMVVEVPAGWNMVPGGSFEEPLDEGWLIKGTHVKSGVTRMSPVNGTGSLKVVATGSGDEKVNHIETDLPVNLQGNKEYTVSLKARWVVGSQSLLTCGFNFGMARSHRLLVPENLGTPGAVNGVTLRQMERAGDLNFGPVIDRLGQSPEWPQPLENVTVRARVQDADGVASVTLRYAVDTPLALFQTLVMTGPDADGFYQAEVPGQAANARVVLEIAAVDARGQSGRFPADRALRTHPLILDPEHPGTLDVSWVVYGHRQPPANSYHGYHFWLHKPNEDYLSARPVHADDYLEGSFVHAASRIYHGAEMRFQGSALSRAGWGGSFRVRMADDRPLHGRFQRFNLDQDGPNIRDRMTHYLVRQNSGGLTVPFSTHVLTTFSVNARSLGTKTRVDPPGSEYISRWFPDDDGGELFEIDERYMFSDGGTAQSRKNAQWLYPPYSNEGASDDKEAYRHYFSLRMDEDDDDFTRLIATARVLTPARTPAAEFDAVIDQHLYVEEFLRVLTIRQNTGDWDTWGGVFGRSAYLYRPAADGRWWLLPWDSDKAYGVDGRPIDSHPVPSDPRQTFANPFPEVERLLNRPRIKRLYYALLKDMVDGHFTPEYLDPYLDALQEIGATNDSLAIGRPNGFIDQRGKLIRGWIAGSVYPERRLEISTNGGEGFETDAAAVELAGSAPADVATILIAVNGSPIEGGAALFSSSDFFGWSAAAVPLAPGANRVEALGFDLAGNLIDIDVITITRGTGGGSFVRGDTDLDGAPSLTDAIRVLGYLFQGGTLPCLDAADVDDSGLLDITDAIRLLNYLFLGGDAPPAPFPGSGGDPTADGLDCSSGP